VCGKCGPGLPLLAREGSGPQPRARFVVRAVRDEELAALLNLVEPVWEDSLGFAELPLAVVPLLRDHFAQAPAKEQRRRPRKLTPARALRTAAKAGNVTTVTIDGATFTLGAQADAATAESNPFELEARRLRRQRGAA
jgi:hypothetical protein